MTPCTRMDAWRQSTTNNWYFADVAGHQSPQFVRETKLLSCFRS